jgi:hypothetical protein
MIMVVRFFGPPREERGGKCASPLFVEVPAFLWLEKNHLPPSCAPTKPAEGWQKYEDRDTHTHGNGEVYPGGYEDGKRLAWGTFNYRSTGEEMSILLEHHGRMMRGIARAPRRMPWEDGVPLGRGTFNCWRNDGHD